MYNINVGKILSLPKKLILFDMNHWSQTLNKVDTDILTVWLPAASFLSSIKKIFKDFKDISWGFFFFFHCLNKWEITTTFVVCLPLSLNSGLQLVAGNNAASLDICSILSVNQQIYSWHTTLFDVFFSAITFLSAYLAPYLRKHSHTYFLHKNGTFKSDVTI